MASVSLCVQKNPETFYILIYLMNKAMKGNHFYPIPSNVSFPCFKNFSLENHPKDTILKMKMNVAVNTAGNENDQKCLEFLQKHTNVNLIPDITGITGQGKEVSLFTCYKVVNTKEKEEEFRKLSKNNTNIHYKFHGSKSENWYSILINGIKNYSNNNNMTCGAAYGPGVYLSDKYSYSSSYSSSSRDDGMHILGVYCIIGNESQYQKATNIFVVPCESKLILRYLIVTKYPADAVKWLDEYFRNEIKTKSIVRKGTKRLFNEYKKLQLPTNGINVTLYNEDLTNWKVNFTNFDSNSLLSQDMQFFAVSSIQLQVIFSEDFPFYPPFVRIISPIFKAGTGHITSEGAICMELLVPSKWSQIITMENILIQIKTFIIEGSGRILKKGSYGRVENAKESFLPSCKSARLDELKFLKLVLVKYRHSCKIFIL